MEEIVRIDKWLWAARFYKTRSLAAEAVAGGLVHCNQTRIKPSKTIKPGDILVIQKDQLSITVTIQALPTRRGPAKEAALLYEETPESLALRQLAREQNATAPIPITGGRPTKKDRRSMEKIRDY
ncbi:MAG: RNA-binding S4 domain-containing protein [Magnetococcales bacterium]|nr:RNA-binding S4 domain-containing protein [Magnetococcales bacterium]